MGKVKAHELRKQERAELEKQLVDFKQELAQLRVAQVTGAAPSKLAKIQVVRKDIARVLTVLTAQQRQAVRDAFKGKKYLPTDLRTKKTRAIRRRLSPKQQNAKTLRQRKKLAHFPQRKYAVKN